jgi:hypothetical protein
MGHAVLTMLRRRRVIFVGVRSPAVVVLMGVRAKTGVVDEVHCGRHLESDDPHAARDERREFAPRAPRACSLMSPHRSHTLPQWGRFVEKSPHADR